MPLLLLAALQVAILPLPSDFDLRALAPVPPSAGRACDRPARAGEIVVCGQAADRYRLPLPAERAATGDRAPGDLPTGTAALTPVARCGIFEGQRRCGKAEAAEHSYGAGRDPVTMLVKIVRKVVDPDAD